MSAMKTKTTIALLLCATAGLAFARLLNTNRPTATNTPPAQVVATQQKPQSVEGADDFNGRTFLWEAGGKEGITLDVLIRATPQGNYHFIEKATITIDKDGRILKIEGQKGRTRIRS
jgi:hypothetical protein